MKRPSKEDWRVHAEWVMGVNARLLDAWYRHPLLVLRALRWFIRSEHRKGVWIEDGTELYAPLQAMKTLFLRLHKAWRGAYGCTCDMRGVNCRCNCLPDKPSITLAAQWVRQNSESP